MGVHWACIGIGEGGYDTHLDRLARLAVREGERPLAVLVVGARDRRLIDRLEVARDDARRAVQPLDGERDEALRLEHRHVVLGEREDARVVVVDDRDGDAVVGAQVAAGNNKNGRPGSSMHSAPGVQWHRRALH